MKEFNSRILLNIVHITFAEMGNDTFISTVSSLVNVLPMESKTLPTHSLSL